MRIANLAKTGFRHCKLPTGNWPLARKRGSVFSLDLPNPSESRQP